MEEELNGFDYFVKIVGSGLCDILKKPFNYGIEGKEFYKIFPVVYEESAFYDKLSFKEILIYFIKDKKTSFPYVKSFIKKCYNEITNSIQMYEDIYPDHLFLIDARRRLNYKMMKIDKFSNWLSNLVLNKANKEGFFMHKTIDNESFLSIKVVYIKPDEFEELSKKNIKTVKNKQGYSKYL